MKRSPKILLASIVAVIFIGGAILSVFKQSQNAYIAEGTLSATDGGWVAPVEGTSTSAPSTSLIDTNLTTILSKQVFSNFMVLNQSGDLNAQTINDLTDQLSSQIIDKVPTAKVYTVADLHIISNPTKEDIKNYGNIFYAIRNKYQNAYIRGIIAPDSPLLDTTDNGTINTYILMGSLYEKIVTDLLQVPVPVSAVSLHLEIINNYSGSAFGLKQFENLNADPVAAVGGLNIYGKNSDMEELIIKKIANYLRENGIIFSTSDPGYGWNNI